MDPRLRVLIADDHPVFRKGLRGVLASVTGIEVVGEAATGDEAIRLVAETQPDVILMDLTMPDVNGIEATERILRASPHVGILVLTMSDDDDSVFAAMRAGARGYLLKGVDQTEVLRAIQAVSSGEAIFSPSIARRLIQYFATLERRVPPVFPELTDREREVVGLVGGGLSNEEIAARLVVSPATAKTHVSRAMVKLGCRDRAQLVVLAYESGLVRPGWLG
jgi:DNA-binding NarL/FixJ family response regulator